MWILLDTGCNVANANMQKDKDLLDALHTVDRPILHLYDWKGDCATYGYFTKPFSLLDLQATQRLKLSLARRPTGGGILFHTCDLAFSVLVPASCSLYSLNTLDNYQVINQPVARAIQRLMGKTTDLLPTDPLPITREAGHFCMAKPTIYDVMIGGQKVGGAAQRRTRQGFLHQGTIALARPKADYLRQVLLPNSGVQQGMDQNSFTFLPDTWSAHELKEARQQMRQLLVEELTS